MAGAGSWADDSADGLGSLPAPAWGSTPGSEGSRREVDSHAFPALGEKPVGGRGGPGAHPSGRGDVRVTSGGDFRGGRDPSPPRRRSRSRTPPRDRSRDRSPPRRQRTPSPDSWRTGGGRRRSPSPRRGYRGGRSRSPSPPGRRGGYDPPRGPSGDRSRSPPRRVRDPVPFPDGPPYSAFVGNLPYDMDNRQLGGFFEDSHCRVVDARIVMDRSMNPPASRGYGYVDFDNADSLSLALKLEGVDLGGRELHVDVAERRQRSGFGGGSRYGDRDRGGYGDRDRGGGMGESPPDGKERPKFVVAKRGTADKEKLAEMQRRPKSNKPDPFAGAKPRDERLFEERRRERKERESKERAAREGTAAGSPDEERSPRSRPAASPRTSQDMARGGEKPRSDVIVSSNPFDALEEKR